MVDGGEWLVRKRYVVYELTPSDDGRPRYWLRSTGATDLGLWIEQQRGRTDDLAPDEVVGVDRELTERYLPRSTPEAFAALRWKIVRAIESRGGTVVNHAGHVVYVIELATPAPDGRTRLYVGRTSDLEKRLTEHRQQADAGPPAARAVRRYGYARYRPDLCERYPAVSAASIDELETQVSLHLTGTFAVHGDGLRREPRHARWVDESWSVLRSRWESIVRADDAR